MKKIITLIIASILIFSACQQTKKSKYNLDLEKTSINNPLPNQWFKWGNGYTVSVDSTTTHNGSKSILISSEKNRTAQSFGCIANTIPAKFKGENIEISAYIKYENIINGYVGLLLRIDNSSNTLQFDNMAKEHINGSSDWTKYSIKLPIPEEAENIYIGALNTGEGKLWVDDFNILIDGKDISLARNKDINLAKKDHKFDKGSLIDSYNLSENNIENLSLLGKIWGFLKYYHPNIAKGDYNWDYELFRIISKIKRVKTKTERDSFLSEWIKDLGYFEEVKNKKTNTKEIKMHADLNWITESNLSEKLVSQLKKVKNSKRKINNYYISYVPGVNNPIFKNEKAYSEMKYPDTGFRILSLFRLWNIIQYHSPYKYLIKEDWNILLNEFIPKYINAKNELEYNLAVLELLTRVNDSHTSMYSGKGTLRDYWGHNYAPVHISFIENKAVITGFSDNILGKESGLNIGDIILKINGKRTENIVKERLKYTPASNHPTKLRNIAFNLPRTNSNKICFQIDRNNSIKTINTNTYPPESLESLDQFQRKDTCFKIINNNIAYLYPGSLKKDYLSKKIDEIKTTKGLIIDLRSYPLENILFDLCDFLLPSSTDFVKFSCENKHKAGEYLMTKCTKAGKSNKNYYKGKVVILINEITQSNAEYTTMALGLAPKSTIIGSTTAAADGNISPFSLPGGINTRITGIGVYYPDGRETQRVGIIPDIECKPTIEGIRLGKDELLKKGIEIINN